MRRIMFAAAAVGAAGWLLAAPAAAHADESTYLEGLREVGVKVDGPARGPALSLGYSLCTFMYDGTPRETVAAGLVSASTATRAQADTIALAAQHELCPETAE